MYLHSFKSTRKLSKEKKERDNMGVNDIESP